jgi:hypothetical protein
MRRIGSQSLALNALRSSVQPGVSRPVGNVGFETQFVQQFDLEDEDEVHGQGIGARKSKRRRKVSKSNSLPYLFASIFLP